MTRHTLLFLSLLNMTITASAADVTTIVGTGVEGSSGDGAAATAALLSQPFGLVIGPDQALYVCAVGSHAIRRIDPQTQHITTVVGTGQQGYSGNGGPATAANINEPYEIRFDQDGHMFFVEMQNHIVRRVDAKTGIITLVAGCGEQGFAGDGGPATEAKLSRPHSIALDHQGHLYICDIGNHRVRKVVLATGKISTFAGNGQKTITPAVAPIADTPLNGPRALDFDGDHGLILALREGNAIYRLDLNAGTLRHLAGTGKKGYTGDGGPATMATLSGPKGVALAKNGDVYFADTESHTIRVVRAKTDIVETVVGDGKQGDGPDGDPRKCRLNRPHGIFVDDQNRIYIGDSSNHRVRLLTP